MNVVPLPPRDADSTRNITFVAALKRGLTELADGKGTAGSVMFICNTLDYSDGIRGLFAAIQSRLEKFSPRSDG